MNDINLYKIVKNKRDAGLSWGKISYEMYRDHETDRTKNAWRCWYDRRKNGEVMASNPETNEISPIVICTIDQNATLEDSIWERSNLNPDEWVLDKFWGSLDKPQATFKRREVSTENILNLIGEKLTKDWHTPRKVKSNGEYLFVPCLFDAHIGKASLDRVYGEDYFLDVLDDLVQRALLRGNIGKVLFPLGQDYGHIDNTLYTTTAGTPQEVNGSYGEIIANQVSIAVKAVEYLAQSYPVDVIMVPGNHDRYSNSWLGHVVEQRFYDHPNVTVDNSNNFRKYYQWGNLLLLSTHGNEEGLNTIGNVISTEARKFWGNTEYCEVLTGHIHTRKDTFIMTTEVNGIMVRSFPSLSGPDTWHNLKAFTKNGQGGMGLVYSNKWGVEDVYFSALERFL